MRLQRKKKTGNIIQQNIPFIQPKLKVGQVGDKYEVEADRVADKVVNNPAKKPKSLIQKMEAPEEEVQQKPLASSITKIQRQAMPEEENVQKKCAGCEEEEPVQKQAEEEEPVQKQAEEEEPVQKQAEEEEPVQKQAEEEEPVQKQAEEEEPVQKQAEEEEPVQTKSGNPNPSASIETRLNSSKGGGSILNGKVKNEMESGFGTDFSNVKIHTNSNAVQMSKELGAQAFTHGNDIYFNKGKFNPASKEGKHLLAHELTHTVQQKGAIQKKDEVETTPDYCSQVKGGFNIAFYDAATDETERRAKDWAKNFNAVGLSNKGDVLANTAISDKNDVSKTIIDVSKKVGLSCNEDKSPVKVKNLAIFAHGTEDWCGIGNAGITGQKAKTLVKKIAPHLSEDINVILYACSVARGPSEKESWTKGTLDSGGKDSLADKFSDNLNENDIKKGKVWGHTTVGHTSRNFALRSFSSSDKKNVGSSYVSEYVFTPYEVFLIKDEIVKELNKQGYITDPVEENYPAWFNKNLRPYFYSAYAKANENKKYNNINLAEAAPVYPVEVAKVINEYWENDYWPQNKNKFIEKVIKDLKLKISTP